VRLKALQAVVQIRWFTTTAPHQTDATEIAK